MTEKKEIEITAWDCDGWEGETTYKINDQISLHLHWSHAGGKWWFHLEDGNDKYYCISPEDYDKLQEIKKAEYLKKKSEEPVREPKEYKKRYL